jgi:hypothetical protein
VKPVKEKMNKNEKIVNKKITEEFTLHNATIYGGYNLFSDYIASNGLDHYLEQQLTGMKAPWATYSMPNVCRTLIDGYALGLQNIYQFEGIENDVLLAAKRGLEKLPDQSVLRKDLNNQFQNDEDVNRLRFVKSAQVKSELKRLSGNLVLEFDSTVEVGYGFQEGLVPGYNPQKPGRASYHPQLCRERQSGLSVWSRLRPGNTVSATDFVDFLEESWQVVPKRFKRVKKGLSKVLTRMDSGYEIEEAMSWNEERGVGYVIRMTMKGDLWSQIYSIPKQAYRAIETEVGIVEVCSFEFQRKSWSKPRRLVIARWKDDTARAQMNLFDDMGYMYTVLVTNLSWNEEDIYRFYDKRADVENHIREGKYDFCIDHISSEHFHANAADLELRLLAMNQLILFTKKVLKQRSPRHFASTVRRKWLLIPAKLLTGGRQLRLKLSDRHPFCDQWFTYRENFI